MANEAALRALAAELDPLFSTVWHPMARQFIYSKAHTRGIIKGNQGGATRISMSDLALRLLKLHPVAERNRLPYPVRCVSKVVPQDENDEENQQFVELRKLIPASLIKKKITARSKIMTVRDPKGGADQKVEFMASTQDIDAFMSVQRSAYYQDEEIDKVKWDECQMRLLRDGGDTVISLTPVRGLEWTYDAIWKRASKIYRSDVICQHFGLPKIERTGVDSGIECFCWATDDNPVMDQQSIERIFEGVVDPDDLAMRRYGVFRQVSGRIYKIFDRQAHVIPFDKVYDPSLFRNYWHFRVIDYHQQKPWYVTWVAVSPTHEWYVWNELVARHETRTTYDIRDEIKSESLLDEDSEYNRATLIDPLARVKQSNTGWSVFDDLARGEEGLRRLTPADTKNTNGRMNINLRLKNALTCGVPGNNVNRDGVMDVRYGDRLPTIWFLDNCKGHIDHFMNWRTVDHKQEHVKATKVIKMESQKYSDFCRNLEFLGALNPIWYEMKQSRWEPSRLFQGQRR